MSNKDKSIKYHDLVASFPCFSSFSASECHDLIAKMQVVTKEADEVIVKEDELVDSVYLIVRGEAEVTRALKKRKRMIKMPIAVLRKGEAIGLNDTGFFSASGKRTASVTAFTKMILLKLDLDQLNIFLKQNELETSMYAASTQMLRMRFIKQSLPFAKLSHDRLIWLSKRVQEISMPADTIIFEQGEVGDKCYLIRKGEVEIMTKTDKGDRQLAVLKPPVLFGEATLITRAPRNATAKTLTSCELFILDHRYLSELIESEKNVANMFVSLMVDRSRPLKNPNVSVHERKAPDGEIITILKNPENRSYFKLSREGAFIWQQLDGEHTLQDLTLKLAQEFKMFAPDIVAALISKLIKSEFIINIDVTGETKPYGQSWWVRYFSKFKHLLEFRFALGDVDGWITKIYKRYIHYLFTALGQVLLAIFALAGVFAFIYHTGDVLAVFAAQHETLLLLFILIPFSLVAALLHELGHAFAVKAFDREVHYIGIGWNWFMPLAYTDTSDMWLSPRRPRMLVNLAGIYVDVLVAGFAALLLFISSNPYMDAILWLCALYTYIGALRMLSPFQEMDGYYVLMDWVEKPRLRQASVIWLLKKFPLVLRQPKLLQRSGAEISYWLACILFLLVVSLVTIMLQDFVFTVLDVHPNFYLLLVLPFFVIIISSLRVLIDIKNKTED